jgi:signal transduction histidine kinase
VSERILLHQRTLELQTLVRVAQLINVIDLDFVLTQTMQLVTEVSKATKGSLFLLDSRNEPIQRFLTQRDMPPEISRQVAREVIENGLAGWCVRHRTGAVVDDVTQDERWYIFADDPQTDVRSALCVPVFHENQLQAVITLVNSDVGHFTDSDLQLVTAVANQAGSAVRNAQLFDDLQTKQKQLELILENNSEALLTVDVHFRITLINPEGLNLTEGLSDAVGRRLDQFPQTSLYPQIYERLHRVQTTHYNLSFEIHSEETERDFAINISALLGEDAQTLQGYIISIHDVTSIKEFERLKTNMLHILTHDLKNPINIIWGYIDLLRVDSQSQIPADPRFIDGILRALQRMENLIEEALTAERLLSAGYKEAQFMFAPLPIVREAIESLKPLAASKHQLILDDIQMPLQETYGTPFQLREAMVNLISNAIKYTPAEGTIQIGASTEDNRFTFYVTDTGMGIPANLQSRIFTKFYRAARPDIQEIKGTGLGLSLVKSAVEMHKGQVWFESQVGKGSTFGFWIPLTAPEA